MKHQTSRLCLFGLCLFGFPVVAAGLIGFAGNPAPAAASAITQVDVTQTVSGPTINGFRKAVLGMTQAQVRATIETDFQLPASAIMQSEDLLRHTQVLSVHVPDLVPGGGTAAIAYVFGYQSHRLIEVNILWSPSVDRKITPQLLYQNGETLQQYFASEGFPASRSAGNIPLTNGILLFRATDATGNAVLLTLSGNIKRDPKSTKAVLDPAALTLAYAADPLHPDVFQLSKGSF